MKHILVLYSHFYPAFKAGGPVQSLTNLVDLLIDDFRISVVCSAYDLGDKNLLKNIRIDAWNEYKKNVSVFYTTGNGYQTIRHAIRTDKPDIIYINGLFLPTYNWLPLILVNKSKQKVVMSPRGMLHAGALAVKPLKKKLFLTFFKLFRLDKDIHWHATDEQEKKDVQKIFGEQSLVTVATNIPKYPIALERKNKSTDTLRMIFLSLITEKKNLHVVLEALQLVKTKIQFHICGPVKDRMYWERCQRLFDNQIHEISYMEPVLPSEVQTKLSSYDVFVLPTKGENFGHAIYEALSVGTPALISNHTPWGRLQDVNAGLTIETFNAEDWAKGIQAFMHFSQEEYSNYSRGARQLAQDYFFKNDFKSQYQNLFS